MSSIFDVTPQNQTLDVIDITTGKPVGWTIEIRPEASEQVQAAEAKARSDARANARRGASLESLDKADEEIFVAYIAGWKWGDAPSFNGRPLTHVEFSEENVRRLYSGKSLAWVKRQIERAIADEAAFFR
ncbi:hypothetical protein EA658_16710 [Pseudoxanthomonas winnipegensis]|uniref:Uncharacterized protein n=1 Tax=Pseudoxanthomonas winnipegensis TaxID=2480810 RepID=A0ABY1WCL5_9GAMM|nr:hypothetical protein [Pseudoxanthomonas winnipegensis]TAA11302.1 hypothetical protein EA659_08125 [Pseudoxanthomonas winnipegensis]TAA18725.1 hypothetical protein EA658_16710 [Pseudoxanthomonas winnipegensis]TAH73898.1 hypothetical protein EA657_00035 [Pseudoxanthomonas winnipegensis]